MIRDYLRLVRLPNLFTAVADVVAGFFVAAHLTGRPVPAIPSDLVVLALASACLYAVGTGLNDLLDLAHDRKHNPNRPLPAGRLATGQALGLVAALAVGALLLLQSVGLAATLNGAAILALIASYDIGTRRLAWVGPVNMGLIRMFNVLLGMQIGVAELWRQPQFLPLPLLMLAYVTGLTVLSRSEETAAWAKGAVKWLVLGIVLLDAAVLAAYGLTPVAGLTALLVIPPWLLSRRFYVS